MTNAGPASQRCSALLFWPVVFALAGCGGGAAGDHTGTSAASAAQQAATDELRSAVEACDREEEREPLPVARLVECNQYRVAVSDRGAVAAE